MVVHRLAKAKARVRFSYPAPIFMKKSVILLILDGLGISKKPQGNPLLETKTPTFDWSKENFPYFSLQASGIAVGLPWGDTGSSEVGHLALGTGRIIYQNYPKISLAIENNTFFQKPEFQELFNHLKKYNSKLHLIGLASSSNTHSSLEHLDALLKLCKSYNFTNVYLHLITDGIETLPQQAKEIISQIEKMLKNYELGKIGSISGRYYSMDVNQFWDRTQKTYETLTTLSKTSTIDEVLNQNYKLNLSDEFIKPTLIDNNSLINDNDALLFFNFREDGLRQLLLPFIDKNFIFFKTKQFSNLFILTFTEYEKNLPVKVLFPFEKINNSLSEYLAINNRRQLKISESLKESLITYYFNGLKAKAFQNEYRIIVPSLNLEFKDNYKLQSEEITSRLIQALEENIYDFILVNIANLDLAGHQTNFELAKQTISYVDSLINRIAKSTLELDASLIITSDHGNIEEMFDYSRGTYDTNHNSNPVPFFLIDKKFYRKRTSEEIVLAEKQATGNLIDVSPTILEILNLKIPAEMTGQSLLKFCK